MNYAYARVSAKDQSILLRYLICFSSSSFICFFSCFGEYIGKAFVQPFLFLLGQCFSVKKGRLNSSLLFQHVFAPQVYLRHVAMRLVAVQPSSISSGGHEPSSYVAEPKQQSSSGGAQSSQGYFGFSGAGSQPLSFGCSGGSSSS